MPIVAESTLLANASTVISKWHSLITHYVSQSLRYPTVWFMMVEIQPVFVWSVSSVSLWFLTTPVFNKCLIVSFTLLLGMLVLHAVRAYQLITMVAVVYKRMQMWIVLKLIRIQVCVIHVQMGLLVYSVNADRWFQIVILWILMVYIATFAAWVSMPTQQEFVSNRLFLTVLRSCLITTTVPLASMDTPLRMAIVSLKTFPIAIFWLQTPICVIVVPLVIIWPAVMVVRHKTQVCVIYTCLNSPFVFHVLIILSIKTDFAWPTQFQIVWHKVAMGVSV